MAADAPRVSRERTAKDFILTTTVYAGDIGLVDCAQRRETKTTKILGTQCRLIHFHPSHPPPSPRRGSPKTSDFFVG